MAQTRGRSSTRDRDLFRCRFTFESREAARQFIRQHRFDVIETGQDENQRVTHIVLLDQRQIKALGDSGYASEVLDNASERGRERQREVGRGDRFDGGKTAPNGLGRKIKGGD